MHGTPLTNKKARQIITERYTVPDDLRQRINKRTRHRPAERR